MKRTILAGLLAVAGLLGSAGDAKAIGWGPGGIALSFGARLCWSFDYNCDGVYFGTYMPVAGDGAFAGDGFAAGHPWAYADPFTYGGATGAFWNGQTYGAGFGGPGFGAGAGFGGGVGLGAGYGGFGGFGGFGGY